MAPPGFSELGKQAMDILSKGYHFGLLKLDCKTSTSSGIAINTSGTSNQSSGKVSGSLETKYKCEEYGVSISEKWSTDSILTSELSVMDKLVDGLKLAFVYTFAPQSNTKTGKIKAGYGQDNFKIDADMNIDLSGPMINAAAVFGYEDWSAGYQTAIDTQVPTVTTNNFALGYKTGDTVLHAAVNNGEVFTCSVFQKCLDNLDGAIQLSWLSAAGEAKVGVGAKYKLENDALIRAKINDELVIGLGYQQKIRDGITIFLSASVNGRSFNDGGHKIGCAIELEA